jgi:S1-C subfamily serine protease
MSIYDSDPYATPPRRQPASPWPFLALLVLLGFALGGLLFWLWPHHEGGGGGLDPSAQPRDITPRGDLSEIEQATIAIFKKCSPSVVHVTNLAVQRDSFTLNVQEVPRGTGTGFVWDEKGFIVTNYHVVEGASSVRVILADHSSYDSHEAWGYPDKDLAVIRIHPRPGVKLQKIDLGSSHDLQVGQFTYAIGNPFGLDQSLTTGVVSALGRETKSPNGQVIRGVIQTSAAINPGNSGGPLLDSAGRLIGVNSSILSPSGTFAGIGFAIPVDEVNRIVPQLIAHGSVERPRLGVVLAPDQVARRAGVTEGALVLQVVPNSPAQKAGLRGTRKDQDQNIILGDIIAGIDDQPVKSNDDLYEVIEKHKVGDTVKVAYLRDGQQHQAQVTLAQVAD